MNLVIDQGNTICKLAIFEEGDEPVEVMMCTELSISFLGNVLNGNVLNNKVLKNHSLQSCILSTVKALNPDVVDFLRSNIHYFLLLDSRTPIPISNVYATPQTLGLDRLAAAVGAWHIQSGKPLLVIDMGTAITYDFVSREGVFVGGNIAPGLQMRLKALHQFTDKLPMVMAEKEFVNLGSDTETAIRSGVMQGIVYEVEGYFQELQQLNPNLFAFLTGGDLIYFDGKLKNSIFVSKNLVLIGLNRILQYNVNS